MARLTPVPKPILRDGIYVRVSAVMGRADDRFLSPDIQREQIDKARKRGPASRVVQQWDDIDVSTAKVPLAKRPGLQAALQAARTGEIDRLWVLVLDRFDRDTAALKAFDEIASAGVELWTENGRVDIETPEGYLSTSMQLAIARYQRDRIGKSWKQTHQHRLERGLPHSGKPRFGYIYDRDKRLHVPDPVTGPVLAELYQRYVDGESIYSLVRWINAQGIPTTEGNLWRDRVLRRMLDSGFAAGRITYGEDVYQGIHEKLIDDKLWKAYQASRKKRGGQVNTERSEYVLSGMVRCGRCGGSMVAGQFGARREPKYRCKNGKETGVHEGGYVMASFIEGAVLDWLRKLAAELEQGVDLADAVSLSSKRARRDVEAMRKKLTQLQGQSSKLVEKLVSGVITDDEFGRFAQKLRDEQLELEARIGAGEQEQELPKAEQPSRLAAQLLADWELLPVASRREMLRRLIARVVVTTGRPRAHIEVVPIWS